MYWIRPDTLNLVLFYVLHSLAWIFGGWLMARYTFRLRPAEHWIAGVGIGLVSYIVLVNLLVQGLQTSLALWVASLLVLGMGTGAAWGRWRAGGSTAAAQLPEHAKGDWRGSTWRSGLAYLVVLAVLTVLFTLVGRGLSIFDDYLHIPMVSRMAAGDIPPHFHLKPDVPLAYHYGLQVLAASLTRLGGFFPWSAWDASKALAIALTLLLGYAWLRRQFNPAAALAGVFLFAAGSGARYLLLFLPEKALQWVSQAVTLQGSAADTAPRLAQALTSPWLIEGGGPFPFPFAYHSGIFSSLFLALGASGALPALIVLLLLVLARRGADRPVFAGCVLGLAMAALALSGEHIFVPLWGALAFVAAAWAYLAWRRSGRPRQGTGLHAAGAGWSVLSRAELRMWVVALILSAALSAFQGGYITEILRGLLGMGEVSVVVQGGYTEARLVLQWPPALYSGHLGSLSLFSPPQLLALLGELGPALLALPFAALYTWRRFKRGDWLPVGLGLTALVSIGVPLVLKYGFERSGTRLPATGLWLALVLAYPLLKLLFDRSRQGSRWLLGMLYASTVLSGLVMLAVQLIALPVVQYAYFVEAVDTEISAAYWDKLPAGAEVFDSNAARSPALFGRAQRAHLDLYNPDPAWETLVAQADAQAIAQAGYDFVYIDRTWWQKMDDAQRATFQAECVLPLVEKSFAEGGFRRLLDLSGCR